MSERLTVRKVAKELEVSEKTVRKLIRTKRLPAYEVTPRKTWVRREDLDAFLRSCKTSETGGVDKGGCKRVNIMISKTKIKGCGERLIWSSSARHLTRTGAFACTKDIPFPLRILQGP
jgi:excisionase family DNA binding protein